MLRDPVVDANENFATTFERLSDLTPTGAARAFGDITAAAAGFEVPFFNRVFVFEPPDHEDLAAAVTWMRGREIPFHVTVADVAVAATEPLATDLELEPTGDVQPGMVLSSLDAIPAPDEHVAIEAVTDTEALETFVDLSAAAFGMPPEVAREAMPAEVLADEQTVPMLGRVDGDPVACGLLSRTGDIAGVYTIGVREAYRRRGIGEDVTWAVLRAGRDAGCEVGVLQSSEMGYSVYERMGFETVVEYHTFHLA